MKKIIIILILVIGAFAQVPRQMDIEESKPATNMIGDIVNYDGYFIASTTDGISISSDNGESFTNIMESFGFSGITAGFDKIFAAASRDTILGDDNFPLGGGLYIIDMLNYEDTVHISNDAFDFNPDLDIKNPGNLAYDVEVSVVGIDTVIFMPCFYGGLVRSNDMGANWSLVLPDGRTHTPSSYLSHRHFAFCADTFDVEKNEKNMVYDILVANNEIYTATRYGLLFSMNNCVTFYPVIDTIGFTKIESYDGMLFCGACEDVLADEKHGAGLMVTPVDDHEPIFYYNDYFTYNESSDNIENVICGIEYVDSDLYLACNYGGLVRANISTFDFEQIIPDYDRTTVHHHITSIEYNENTTDLWIGTENGLFRSNNFGIDRTPVSESTFDGSSISDILITELDETTIFAACLANESDGTNAVYYSENDGSSWELLYEDIRVNEMLVDSGIVYLATEDGLFYSTWGTGTFNESILEDAFSHLTTKDNEVFCLTTLLDSVLIGVDRGVGMTRNLGVNFNFYTKPVDYHYDFPVLWDGTAGGIFRSIDGGVSWNQFQSDTVNGLTGDWVVAMEIQRIDDTSILWAVTKRADGDNEYNGISYTTDNGATWNQTAEGVYGWNFAFCGNTVFCATNGGLIRATYPEMVWDTVQIVDHTTGISITDPEIIGVSAADNRLWVGTSQGIAIGDCNAENFRILATYPETDPDDEDIYIYPSPFSPINDGSCFVVFPMEEAGDVTIKVYDWILDEVDVIAKNKSFPAGNDNRIEWYGTNRDGEYTGNGIYFISVETPKKTYWGKVMLLK